MLIGLLPGAAYFWEELYLSGYTRLPGGARDLGHMEKLLGGGAEVPGLVTMLGLPTLLAGLAAYVATRLTGRVTSLRLMTAATAVGALVPTVLVVVSNPYGEPILSYALLAGLGAGAGLVLSIVFSLAAGLPIGAAFAPQWTPDRQRVAAKAIFAGSIALLIVVLVWLIYLYAWGAAHPCTSCG
jgi:hypothetical protein